MTRPARILLVAPRYPPSLGGVERHVAMLATGLASRGLEVQVVTTDPVNMSRSIDIQHHLSIRRFPTIGRDEVFFLSPRLAFWLIREAGRFDLIHAHSYHAPLAFLAAVASWLHHVPFVVTPHYHGTGHTLARRFLHRPYRVAGAWMMRHAELVVCNSEAECTLVHSDFGAALETKVVLPGVETEANPPTMRSPGSNDMTILAGGRLEGYKQVDVVVRAVELLPDGFRLVVFGDGPALEQIRHTIRDAGVERRVDLVGRVTDAELRELFRNATVFASLSRKEAFGLTVLEAAAVGTPVVCSDIPAYREMAGRLSERGLRLVDVDADPGVVAEAIRAAASAPRPSVPLPSALPSWDTMVEGVLEGYRRMLTSRGRTRPGSVA